MAEYLPVVTRLVTCFLYTYFSICNLNTSDLYVPTKMSSKIAVLSVAITFYVIYAYYWASFTSDMVPTPAPFEVKGFEDLLSYDYDLLVQKGTSYHTMLKDATQESIFYKVYQVCISWLSCKFDSKITFFKLKHLGQAERKQGCII